MSDVPDMSVVRWLHNYRSTTLRRSSRNWRGRGPGMPYSRSDPTFMTLVAEAGCERKSGGRPLGLPPALWKEPIKAGSLVRRGRNWVPCEAEPQHPRIGT